MKKIVILFMLTIIACNQSQSGGSQENVFDARKVQAGSQVAGHTVKYIEVSPIDDHDYFAVVRFEGEMTVEGHIDFFAENEGEGWGLLNYFTPAQESIHFIPVLNIDPNRTGFTLEDNQDKDLQKLRENGRRYKVKIRVKNFELYAQGKGQENKATLVEILDAEKVNE
jgi:hypothetical protein